MAKDLPYFKFVISEWNDGDITLCSFQSQGLFINLCSLYWSQEGNLSFSKSKKRFKCKKAWEELIKEEIIKIKNDKISINFLDQQFSDRQKLSKQNSKNIKERWKGDKSDTSVSNSYNGRIDSVYNIEERRREKKREEEKREEKRKTTPTETEIFDEMISDETYVSNLKKNYPNADLKKNFSGCWLFHSQRPSPPEHQWEWRQKLQTWLAINKDKPQRKEVGRIKIESFEELQSKIQ